MLTEDRKDRPAFVSFHRVAVEDKAKSLEAGTYVARDVDYAHVTPPYSKDMMKWKVSEWFKLMEVDLANGRIPREWIDAYKAQYEAWKRGEEPSPNGTPIRGWGMISPGQQETLIRMHVLTVEDAAEMNDEAIRRVGMGALDIKTKCRAWLAQNKDKGPIVQEMAAITAQNRTLESQVETLKAQVAALMSGTPAPAFDESGLGLDADDRSELAAMYKAKHGKNPHPAMGIEKLRAAVA